MKVVLDEYAQGLALTFQAAAGSARTLTDANPPDGFQIDAGDHEIIIDPSARVFAKVSVTGNRNRLILESGVDLIREGMAGAISTLEIIGDDNEVRIEAGTRYGGRISVIGNRNRVGIGPSCNLFGSINFLSADSTLTIGRETTMVLGSIQLHEPGYIAIGEDCMISTQVYLSLSDIHPIYDLATGDRINPAASVTVGRHVWLGLRSMIMKGASIADGSIVAAGAIVSGEVPSNVVVAGIPGRVVRQGVEWRRDFDPPFY